VTYSRIVIRLKAQGCSAILNRPSKLWRAEIINRGLIADCRKSNANQFRQIQFRVAD
jgi:hypothetical protein